MCPALYWLTVVRPSIHSPEVGDLYSVYLVDEMPEEARSFFSDGYGVVFPPPSGGHFPSREQLRDVLDALKGYKVRYSDCAGSWQADIQKPEAPECWATLIAKSESGSKDDAPTEFYFEKSTLSVMVEILERLASQFGAFLLHPHTGDLVVLCPPNAPAQRLEERDDPT